MAIQLVPLIGGSQPWNLSLFTASDDSVRNGGSHSTLTLSPAKTTALFSGYTAINNVTRAGFASQRTVGDLHWDLATFDGLFIGVIPAATDDRVYAITVKDTLPANDNGTNLLFEKNFTLKDEGDVATQTRPAQTVLMAASGLKLKARDGDAPLLDPERENLNPQRTNDELMAVLMPWTSLVPTYQGSTVNNGSVLNISDIKRISIMMRSYFGKQTGNFSLTLQSIGAYKKVPT